jgi:hypothetical protein
MNLLRMILRKRFFFKLKFQKFPRILTFNHRCHSLYQQSRLLSDLHLLTRQLRLVNDAGSDGSTGLAFSGVTLALLDGVADFFLEDRILRVDRCRGRFTGSSGVLSDSLWVMLSFDAAHVILRKGVVGVFS